MELISEWGSVYRDGNKALKVYASSYDYVAEEARVHSLLYNAGLPVPAIYGLRKINGDRTALEMAYIEEQPFMYENMGDDRREQALEVMAKLQCMVNAVDASSFGLPEFSGQIANEISKTPYLTDEIKNKVFALIARLDLKRTSLCHGDIHPYNVLYDGAKHWVIDWNGASIGEPAADACMTYLYEKRFAPQSAELYLKFYCENSTVKREAILAWLPVIAAYQVNIKDEEEREVILNIINEWDKN